MSEQIETWEADGTRWHLVTEMSNEVVVGFVLSDVDIVDDHLTELARGHVKWDGCSNTTIGEHCMWHGCDAGTFQVLARVLERVYSFCVERLGDRWHKAQ